MSWSAIPPLPSSCMVTPGGTKQLLSSGGNLESYCVLITYIWYNHLLYNPGYIDRSLLCTGLHSDIPDYTLVLLGNKDINCFTQMFLKVVSMSNFNNF